MTSKDEASALSKKNLAIAIGLSEPARELLLQSGALLQSCLAIIRRELELISLFQAAVSDLDKVWDSTTPFADVGQDTLAIMKVAVSRGLTGTRLLANSAIELHSIIGHACGSSVYSWRREPSSTMHNILQQLQLIKERTPSVASSIHADRMHVDIVLKKIQLIYRSAEENIMEAKLAASMIDNIFLEMFHFLQAMERLGFPVWRCEPNATRLGNDLPPR